MSMVLQTKDPAMKKCSSGSPHVTFPGAGWSLQSPLEVVDPLTLTELNYKTDVETANVNNE